MTELIFSGVHTIVDVATAQQQQTESRGNKLKQLLLKAKKELAETKQLVSWCLYHIILQTSSVGVCIISSSKHRQLVSVSYHPPNIVSWCLYHIILQTSSVGVCIISSSKHRQLVSVSYHPPNIVSWCLYYILLQTS